MQWLQVHSVGGAADIARWWSVSKCVSLVFARGREVTTAPSVLYARLCHAFLVVICSETIVWKPKDVVYCHTWNTTIRNCREWMQTSTTSRRYNDMNDVDKTFNWFYFAAQSHDLGTSSSYTCHRIVYASGYHATKPSLRKIRRNSFYNEAILALCRWLGLCSAIKICWNWRIGLHTLAPLIIL